MLGPVDGLTDTAGIVALVGVGVGAAALILSIVLAVKLRRLRAATLKLISFSPLRFMMAALPITAGCRSCQIL